MKSTLLTGSVLLLVLLSQVDAKPSPESAGHKVHPALQKFVVISALASRARGKQLGEIWSDCSKS